jgi:predicted GNAT family acetyltransferase
MLLTAVPENALDALVATLRARGASLSEVNGEAGLVRRFADAWTAGTLLRARPVARRRLHALGNLIHPAVPGQARRATTGDLPTVSSLVLAMHAEVGEHDVVMSDAALRADVAEGRAWLWEVGSEVVALAMHKPPAAGTARVGPVFTAPQHRRHGYGAAVTAAVSAGALAAGARQVVLFAVSGNATANATYHRIGYRPVSERQVVRFTGAHA